MNWENISEEILGTLNEHGWSLKQCAEDKEHHDLGLVFASIQNKFGNGAEISEEEKEELTLELTRWEFTPSKQLQVFEELGIDGENTANMILETAQKFEDGEEKKISDLVDVEEYTPGKGDDELKDLLGEETTEQINEWYKKTDKKLGENGPDTLFFTALKDMDLGDGRKIEEGEVVELPAELEDEFEIKDPNQQIMAVEMYECPSCNERARHSGPCPNPNCKRKKLNPLHPHTEAEVEEAIRENYPILTVRESNKPNKTPIMYAYSAGSYRDKGIHGLIDEWVAQMRPQCRPAFRSRVIKNIASKTQIFQENLGAPDGKVVVENGILDLRELTEEGKDLSEIELEPHAPEVYATSKIHAEFDPDAECPLFEELYEGLLPDDAARRAVQEVLGTALVNEKLHKKGVVLVGRTDSGKSTFAEIVQEVFGGENTESESLKDLADTRWGAISLLGKAINICTEMSTEWLNNLGKLKKMFAGEKTKAEDKGKSKIEITPFAEHLYCANQTPKASRQAEAFWNRFFVIEVGDKIPKVEQDPQIKEKILEKERSGILNWLIEGYVRFVKDPPESVSDNANKFTVKQKWADARDTWLGWGDSVQRFIQQCIHRDPEGKISTRELYDAYLDFCDKEDRLEPGSQRSLTNRVKQMVRFAEHGRYRFEDGRKNGFKNIVVACGEKSVQNVTGGTSLIAKEKKNSKSKSKKNKKRPGQSGHLGSSEDVTLNRHGKESTIFRVIEKSEHKGTVFKEGEEIVRGGDLPEDAVEEAIKRGYLEKVTLSTTGNSGPAQERKIRDLCDIIRELQDDYAEGAPLNAVKVEAKGEGITPEFVDEFVEVERNKKESYVRVREDADGEIFLEVS